MAKQKSFAGNPALQFISRPAPQQEEPQEIRTVSEDYPETKSRRVQLLVQPSVFAAVDRIARKKRISRNEAINEALKQYAEREGEQWQR